MVALGRQAGAQAEADLVGQLGGRLLVERLAQQLDGGVVLVAVGEQLGQLEAGVDRPAADRRNESISAW